MTVLFPEATPVLGNQKVLVVDTVALLTAPDLSTEIGAGTTLDISCFIRDWNPDVQANPGQAPPRMCTTLQLPQEGRTQMQAIELRYVYDPQAATSTTMDLARLMLLLGLVLLGVFLLGLPYTPGLAFADYTETVKFRCGRQNYIQGDGDEFREYEIRQFLYPLADFTHGQVVA